MSSTASVANLGKDSVITISQLREVACKKIHPRVIRKERIMVKTFSNSEFQARDFKVVLTIFCTRSQNFFVEVICSPFI